LHYNQFHEKIILGERDNKILSRQISGKLLRNIQHISFTKRIREKRQMATGLINVQGLDPKDIEFVEKLIERLRDKSLREVPAKGGFKRSAGSWKGLIDGEELKRNVYEDRLISTRPEVNL
jgi:hypothetical protein